jgi:membrane-bound lytic murein transglycosylase D
VTVRQIMDWNRLPSARVKAGKVLRIHSSESSEPVHQIASRSRTQESEPAQRLPDAHRVRRGETASSIALRYGVSTDDLLEANGLRGSRLRVGQKLVLPRSKAARLSTRVASTRETVVARAPETPRAQVRERREDTPDRSLRLTRYTVRPGDTLYSIARARSTTVDSLKQINGLSKANLRVGQIIKVPGNG